MTLRNSSEKNIHLTLRNSFDWDIYPTVTFIRQGNPIDGVEEDPTLLINPTNLSIIIHCSIIIHRTEKLYRWSAGEFTLESDSISLHCKFHSQIQVIDHFWESLSLVSRLIWEFWVKIFIRLRNVAEKSYRWSWENSDFVDKSDKSYSSNFVKLYRWSAGEFTQESDSISLHCKFHSQIQVTEHFWKSLFHTN